jgi:hypothetical protein
VEEEKEPTFLARKCEHESGKGTSSENLQAKPQNLGKRAKYRLGGGGLKEEDRYDMADHCRYKFVAHIEGARYSARLKYLQHCNSVNFTH